MFGVGWTEFALVAAVAIVVIGPKDMPHVLYKAGQLARKIKIFMNDIQSSLDAVTREAQVDDIARSLNREIGGAGVDEATMRQLEAEEKGEKDLSS